MNVNKLLQKNVITKSSLNLFLFVVLTFLLIILIQTPTFETFFMADDFWWLDFAGKYSDISQILIQKSPGGWTTIIPNFLFWGQLKVFKYNPLGYYFVNSIIHFFNCLLVYNLVLLISRRKSIAITSSIIFAIHFIHYSDWGPLVWIAAFVQLIVAFFYLISVLFFVKYKYSGKLFYYWISILSFILAIISKETAISLPILLLAWTIIGFPQIKKEKNFLRSIMPLIPFLIILGIYLLYEINFQLSGHYIQTNIYGFGIHNLQNWKYFSNLLLPNPNSPPVKSFMLRSSSSILLSIFQLGTALTRVFIFLGLLVLWIFSRKSVRLWIAFLLIVYLPFIGFIEGFAGPNRYFYLSSIGFSVLFAKGLIWFYDRLKHGERGIKNKILFVIILVFLFLYNFIPIRIWQTLMINNSAVRRQTISLIEEKISSIQPYQDSLNSIYLIGYPQKFGDLEKAINTQFDIGAVFVDSDQDLINDTEPTNNVLLLSYENGEVILNSK